MSPVSPLSPRRVTLAVLAGTMLAVTGVAFVQQTLISASNFGGADEWLLLDLTSRRILGIPYANRPLVLLWHALPARLWPGSLAAFWACAALYRAAAGLITAALALRLAPGRGRLALVAGTVAVAWTPIDRLRLDTVLICGYEGATFAALAAVLLFVVSWQRRSPALLVSGCLLGFVTALSGESVVPVLGVAPVLLWSEARAGGRRLAAWALGWEAVVGLAALHAATPLLSGQATYQTQGLGLDLSVGGVLERLLDLLGMQFLPLFAPGDVPLVPAVAVAAGTFAAGFALAGAAAKRDDRETGNWPLARVLVAGLLLAISAHATMALTPIRNPARTQILPGAGFALALAAALSLAARALPRGRSLLLAAAGAWVVAVGTGRLASMQAEWDSFRSSFQPQAETLARLTAEAPALRPGTLVLLIDSGQAWPMTFTFAHALRYLYGDGVAGVVQGANSYLYASAFTADGVMVTPWPVIRQEWQVRPTFHPWDTVVVVSRDVGGRQEILPRWPAGLLPPLPPGATYAPQQRILPSAVRQRERRVLAGRRPALFPPAAATAGSDGAAR